MKITPRLPTKITPIAAAALIAAVGAGVGGSIMPFVNGSATAELTARVTAPAMRSVHTASHARPSAHRSAKRATATTAAKPATAPQQPAAAPAAGSQTPASTAQAGTGTATATGNQPLTAGMSSFEQCVAWRESGDNPTASSAGLFGILPPVWASLGYSGTAGQASVAQQEAAFNQLYAQYGAQPWAPSDGC
jgi:hypothetical protein